MNLLAICLTSFITLARATRKGDHVFYDTDLVHFVDPLKHGFNVILTDAAHENLFANPFQLPAVYLTVVPLNSRHNSIRQILFKDAIRDKVIKVTSGLEERSWYYVCLEYETFSIGVGLNETTSTKCGIHRTLDKFGKGASQALSEVKIAKIDSRSMHFQLVIDASYPLSLIVYLQEGSAPAQMLVVESTNAKSIDVVFRDLEPATFYGELCVLEQPMLRAYTAMSRTIQTQLKSCWFSGSGGGLKTAMPEIKASSPAASQQRMESRVLADFAEGRSGADSITLVASLVNTLVLAILCYIR